MFQTLGGGPRRFFFRGLVALHELAVTIDPGRVLAHANERRTRPLGSSFLEKTGRYRFSRRADGSKDPYSARPKRYIAFDRPNLRVYQCCWFVT
jgi:hypothetical protein